MTTPTLEEAERLVRAAERIANTTGLSLKAALAALRDGNAHRVSAIWLTDLS